MRKRCSETSISVFWFSSITDVRELTVLWLRRIGGKPKLEVHHPMIQGFSNHLEEFKSRVTEKVSSTIRIWAPIFCQTVFEEEVLFGISTAERFCS